MGINMISATIALGKKESYFYSPYAEGLISLCSENLAPHLCNPGDTDYSLGNKIMHIQNNCLKLQKGGRELSEDDLEFICDVLGTRVVQSGDAEKCNILLAPFKISLHLDIIELENRNRISKVERFYNTKNVRAGIFDSKFGIRYGFELKKY